MKYYVVPTIKVLKLEDNDSLLAASGPGAGDFGGTPGVGAKASKTSFFTTGSDEGESHSLFDNGAE